jgi:hypothetical protein
MTAPTQEDIIRMARESGMAGFDGTVHAMYQLESFAALVAAAEREACAKVVVEESGRWAIPLNSTEYLQMWDECAAAIRARGNT